MPYKFLHETDNNVFYFVLLRQRRCLNIMKYNTREIMFQQFNMYFHPYGNVINVNIM